MRPFARRRGSSPGVPLFLTSKVRLHCDGGIFQYRFGRADQLFLTSKVRLHCDYLTPRSPHEPTCPFPDLKGQAPLRRTAVPSTLPQSQLLFLTSKVRLHCDLITDDPIKDRALFLTSKVRLHCDAVSLASPNWAPHVLFLTSKVRLHCDASASARSTVYSWPFPDLKGQAPLRPG